MVPPYVLIAGPLGRFQWSIITSKMCLLVAFVPLKGAAARLGRLLICEWSARVREDSGNSITTHLASLGARPNVLSGGRDSWRVDLCWRPPSTSRCICVRRDHFSPLFFKKLLATSFRGA